MKNKYIYIIVGIVVLFIIVLVYQNNQNNKKIAAAQQAVLAQQPNSQFGQYGGLITLASSLLQGLGAGVGSNIGKPKTTS